MLEVYQGKGYLGNATSKVSWKWEAVWNIDIAGQFNGLEEEPKVDTQMNDATQMTIQVWQSLRVGDKFRTPDRAVGEDFSISIIEPHRIYIQPQSIWISRKGFQAALEYLLRADEGNRCEIRSSNDIRKAGPLCKASRSENNNTRCINYIVPILKANGIADFSGRKPNTVWLVANKGPN